MVAKAEHDSDCPCAACDMQKQGVSKADAIAAIEDRNRQMMERYGWLVHAVVCDDDQSPTGYNVHSHGCQESWGHPDFQVVLPIDPQIAHSLIANIVERVKMGETFKAGDRVSEVIGGGLDVLLLAATECNRQVLRIVFPDADGVLPPTSETYSKQMDGTTDGS